MDDLPEARARLATLAVNLAARFDPDETAHMLVSCACGLITQAHGPIAAREFFEQLIRDIDANIKRTMQ